MVVAANKIDALDEPERLDRLRAHVAERGLPLFAVSAATGDGMPALLEAVWQAIARQATGRSAPATTGEAGVEEDSELDPARRR
jgi:GTP-binding protein